MRQILCGSHIKIWNLANHMKKWNKEHQTLSFQFFINDSSILMPFVLFFHVVCKISYSNMWTAKHFAQGSCTEFTLLIWLLRPISIHKHIMIININDDIFFSFISANWVTLTFTWVITWGPCSTTSTTWPWPGPWATGRIFFF